MTANSGSIFPFDVAADGQSSTRTVEDTNSARRTRGVHEEEEEEEDRDDEEKRERKEESDSRSMESVDEEEMDSRRERGRGGDGHGRSLNGKRERRLEAGKRRADAIRLCAFSWGGGAEIGCVCIDLGEEWMERKNEATDDDGQIIHTANDDDRI